jgi:hypothetical protein
MAAGDWPAACDLWAQARGAAPDDSHAYIKGVEALVRAYRFEDAFDLAALMEERFAGAGEVEVALAGLDARRGRWAQAAARYEARMAAAPGSADQILRAPEYRQSVFNAYGILEGARRLDPAPHEPERGPAPARQGYVFVSGMPRAGTTALGHMLNTRKDLALFVELHNPYLTYTPASFLPEVVEERRARTPTVAIEQTLAKADAAAFIGDKRPLFHYSMPHTLQALSGFPVTVLHMLRDPALVAASYKRRADNPEDGWDPLRDLDNCIHELNVMHRFLVDWTRSADPASDHQLIFVDYDRAFRDGDYVMDLFKAIGVDRPDASRGGVNRVLERSAKVLAKEREIPRDIRDALEAGVDKDALHAVSEISGIDITL